MSKRVVIKSADLLAYPELEIFNKKLNLLVVDNLSESHVAALTYENGFLSLEPNLLPRVKPINIDFMAGELAHMKDNSVSKKQLLARAIGIKHKPITIIDLTSGLLKDSFFFSCLGLKVTAIERDPIIFELQQDAISRAKLDIDIHLGEAKEILPSLGKFDVAFIDPMFPHKTKKALASKEMQLFQALIGVNLEQEDTDLLKLARKSVRGRVVVKRPLSAEPLDNDFKNQFTAKSVRYDLYMPICL